MRLVGQLILVLCVIVAIEYAIALLAVAFFVLIVAGLIFEPVNTLATLALLVLVAGLSSHFLATVGVVAGLAGIALIVRQVGNPSRDVETPIALLPPPSHYHPPHCD